MLLPRTKASVDRFLVRRPPRLAGYPSSSMSPPPPPSRARPPPRSSSSRSKRRRFAAAVVLVLVVVTLAAAALWFIPFKWNSANPPPRKKLDYRWWEIDQPPPDDLAALLPKPNIASSQPLPLLADSSSSDGKSDPKPAKDPRRGGHTYAQLLRLPSTFTTASPPVTWTAVVHLASAASASPPNLVPLLSALSAQSPAKPNRILLLLPRTIRPPSDDSLDPDSVGVIAYSHTRGQPRAERDRAALMALIDAASTGEIESDYLLLVDVGANDDDGSDGAESRSLAQLLLASSDAEVGSGGKPKPGGGPNYVGTLLHASGTNEYRASLLSAGGLALAPPSTRRAAGPPRRDRYGVSPDADEQEGGEEEGDKCLVPLRDASASASASARRISIPTTPILLPVSWLVPRDPSDPTHTSIVQGIPPSSRLGELGIAGTLAAALWTKHAIPSYALPLVGAAAAAGGGGGSGGDGEVAAAASCERFKTALTRQVTSVGDDDERAGTVARARNPVTATSGNVRSLFAEQFGAGEGLRLSRLSGDRARGGGGGGGRDDLTGGPVSLLERAEEIKSDLLQTGTAVILVSGEEELAAVRKLACRFAAQGVGRRDPPPPGKEGGQPGMEEEEEEDDARGRRRSRRPRIRRDLKVVVADLDLATTSSSSSSSSSSDSTGDESQTAACHLDLTPLRGGSLTSGTDGGAASLSVPLLDLLESLNPPPAFILYLTDSPRAREFEEVLRWSGGYFGPRQGQGRLSRVRAERTMLRGGAGGNKIRPTVVGMAREEAKRAEWIGALSLEALRHFHTPRIDISVVTNDRPISLHRLLTSLRTAHYFGDDVSLALNLEQTADRLTHRLVDDLNWPHGSLSVRHRILLGGLMPAIVESWYPTSNDTYGVLLEDDVEVSPLFYGWLKFAILHYRYTLAGRKASPRLFGVSLYQQKNIELRPEGRQPFDAHALFRDLSLPPTTPYLSQIPCSWGAAYFPEQWREFHTYLALRLSELALSVSDPIVPEIRSNRWPRSWKKYFIELVYLRGYTMLYPNYPGFESLSTNHLEIGTHVHTAVEMKKKALFEVPLLPRSASLVDSLPGPPGLESLPAWESLPILDLWGSLASAEELLERGWQTTRMIGSCGTAQLPSLEPQHLAHPRYDAHELLCRRVWNRENEGRLVDAQPLRGTGTADDEKEDDDDDLLPHRRQFGAAAAGNPDQLQNAPLTSDGDALADDLPGVPGGRRTVELSAGPIRGDASHDDDDDDDEVPTVARLDNLPTEIRYDDDDTSVPQPPAPAAGFAE